MGWPRLSALLFLAPLAVPGLFSTSALAQPAETDEESPASQLSTPPPAPEPAGGAAPGGEAPREEEQERATSAPAADAAAESAAGESRYPPAAQTIPPREQDWEEDVDAKIELARRGSFSLYFGGMIQVQSAFYVGEDASRQYHDPADNEGFRVRRARFGFGGQMLPDIGFYLAVDLKDAIAAAAGGDHGSEVLDASLTWNRYSVVQVSVGVAKVPYSAFSLQSSSKLTIIERPLMTTLIAPDRRVGLRVFGRLGALGYAAGLYNGSEGITSGNRLAGLAAAVRLTYDILGGKQAFVPDDLALQLGGAYVYDNGPAVNADKIAISLGASGYRASLLGELLWERSKPDAAPTGDPQAGVVKRWGAAGQLGVFIWRSHVEVAARYEYFRDNEELLEFGRQQLITGGLNVYLCHHRFKLQANYIRRDERSGPGIANDIAFAQLQGTF